MSTNIPFTPAPEREEDKTFRKSQRAELSRARACFPTQPLGYCGHAYKVLAALMEEVGELATALMEERWQNVEAEAVQVAVMAQRLATECQYLRGTFGEADNK